MIKDHPGFTFGLWIILIWVSLGAAAATDHSTFFEIAWIASLFYGLFLVGNYWFRARPRRKKAQTAASPGPSEPIKEPEQLQSQFESTFAEQIEILAYLLYTRGCRLAKVRFPGEEPNGIGAHVKLYCTGEGENEQSIAASTPKQRELAAQLADEIMAINVPGLYAVPASDFVPTMKALPEDDLASIRRLALCYDKTALLHMMSLAYDATKPPDERVNKDALAKGALPLLRHAERYDGDSAALQTTIAQTYYTLGDVDSGFVAAEKATRLDPENAEAWRLLGNGHMGRDNDAEAISCLNRALSIDPMINGAREALALIASTE